jgi:hypothetical protein
VSRTVVLIQLLLIGVALVCWFAAGCIALGARWERGHRP